MAEKPYSGLTASILLNGVLLGYMNSVDLNLERNVAEVLAFGSQYAEKVPAIKNWTASSDGTVAFVSGGSQHKLYQAYETGEAVTLKIKLDESVYFEGQAIIGSLAISGSADDALTISVDFEGSGAIVFNLPVLYNITITSGVGGTTSPAGLIRAAAGTLVVTCVPAAGKVADKYYVNDSSSGISITGNSFNYTVAADASIHVTFKDQE